MASCPLGSTARVRYWLLNKSRNGVLSVQFAKADRSGNGQNVKLLYIDQIIEEMAMEIIIFGVCCLAGWAISRPVIRLLRTSYEVKRGMVAARIRVTRV